MSDPFIKYEGLKLKKESALKVADSLVVEQALQININGKPFTVVMQTPGAEKELVQGLLYNEDILKKETSFNLEFQKNNADYIELINVICDEKKLGSGFLSKRSLLSMSSCGICGKQELGDVLPHESAVSFSEKLSVEFLHQLQIKMFESQPLYKETGGCHGAAVFSLKGDLLAAYEDIGRHNALDKIVGKLLFDKTMNEAKILSFSGRVSYEIVSKCFRAKIPVIIAVSAPSTLAVDFAKEYGMTLIAFARGEQMTCYSNPQRIA